MFCPMGHCLIGITQKNSWVISIKTTYWTRYHDWRWWDGVNRQFVTESINSGERDVMTMMRALRRVGIWFYIGHSTYTRRGGTYYLLFGKAIWRTDGFILSSPPPLSAHNPYYGTIDWTPKFAWYAISNLPDGDLSHLKLAVIVSCHGAGGDFPQSYPLLDWIVAKGCPLALGLVVNAPLTSGTQAPPGINETFAKKWAKWFWYYAAKGTDEPIKDDNGNILQPSGRRDILAAANLALYKAAGKGARKPPRIRFGTGIYSRVIVVEGPSPLGARPYSVYFVHQPYVDPGNYYISPSSGGQDDRTLRVMQISNLYP